MPLRNRIVIHIFLGIFCCLSQLSLLYCQRFGQWQQSGNGMPVYNYIGVIPVTSVDKDGKDANLPEDPYFLLGNYRMTLITHVSGIYQLLSAERAWARANASEQTNYGWNEASITSNTKGQPGKRSTSLLTGLSSIATDTALTRKYFGVGFARYEYKLNQQLTCTRILSTRPSLSINSGSPAFVVTVVITNGGRQTQQVKYKERVLSNFVLNSTQYSDKSKRPFLYQSDIKVHQKQQMAIADVSCKAASFFAIPGKSERFMYDLDPPSLFMMVKSDSSASKSYVYADSDTLATSIELTLKPGETISTDIIIGLVEGNNFSDVLRVENDLFADSDHHDPAPDGLYADQWKSKLPDLGSEKNQVLHREMLWNAHFIEASAKYSKYYDETFIPQGSVYSYYFGDNISNRDHLQAALPACYTNPALAKSIIRYVIKHTEEDGEIKRGNSGFGYSTPSIYKESDEQLYFFNTIAEYLLITRDYSFLEELVAGYPAESGKKDTVQNILAKMFTYLRDEVGIGQHGLVRILNSDWSDSFFHEYSPNRYGGAESHLNSAMVLAVFPKLIQALEYSRGTRTLPLIHAMELYRKNIESAFMKDLGERNFSARAYLNNKLKFGLDNVCLEPQGYLLQIPGLAVERKKAIYNVIKTKLISPEKIGIRTREKPLWNGNPDGEDGGIWFSLEYPVLLGVAMFDKAEARALLLKFSFQNFTDHYPDYWVGQWTAADEVNSTLYREGLYSFWVPSQDRKKAFQGFCSHPHAWPLYCYFKIKE